jgi:hypothetical protein
LLNDIIKSHIIKKFSGRPEDFDEFARQWDRLLGLISDSMGKEALSDAYCLAKIQEYLDPASLALLETRRLQNPNLGYYDFWDEFKGRYQKDVQASYRRNWQQVRLNQAGKRLTLQEWLEYQSKYLGKRQLVDNWSAEEDHAMVYSSLPRYYKEKVKQETADRRENKKLVRISCTAKAPIHQALQGLRKHGFTWQVVRADAHSAIVQVADEATKATLLGWDQGGFAGGFLKIQPVQYEMTGDDILQFIQGLLEFDQEFEMKETCFALQGREPQKICTAQEPQSKGKNKGGGSPPQQHENKPWAQKNSGWKTAPGQNQNQSQSPTKGKGKWGRGDNKQSDRDHQDNHRARTPPSFLRERSAGKGHLRMPNLQIRRKGIGPRPPDLRPLLRVALKTQGQQGNDFRFWPRSSLTGAPPD